MGWFKDLYSDVMSFHSSLQCKCGTRHKLRVDYKPASFSSEEDYTNDGAHEKFKVIVQAPEVTIEWEGEEE